jgi:hypothetical protein
MFIFFLGQIGRCEDNNSALADFKVTAIIDFNLKKIWFSSPSKDTIFISLSGSVIDLDALLSGDPNDLCIRPYSVQSGFQWLMAVPRGKPNSAGGLNILNFEKTKERFNRHGFIEISAPIFKLSDRMIFSGPLILGDKIHVIEAKPEDIDDSRLILIPVRP